MILSSLPFENDEITIEKVMAGIMLLFVYFIPTIISWNIKNSKFVIAFNVLTAWTILGWLIAFVWALNISRQHKIVLAEERRLKKELKKIKKMNELEELDNYDLGLDFKRRAEVRNRAEIVGGICGTITAIDILNHFNINISDIEIKNGILDSKDGTNQVNMALFMSQYLDVTFCVNYNIEDEIKKGDSSKLISKEDMVEFSKLLKTDIKFEITPSLRSIIEILNNEDALAQFVFLQKGQNMTHYGLLCKVENNLLEFSQRVGETFKPDVNIIDFYSWWDLQGKDMDPEQLVFIYRKKTNRFYD